MLGFFWVFDGIFQQFGQFILVKYCFFLLFHHFFQVFSNVIEKQYPYKFDSHWSNNEHIAWINVQSELVFTLISVARGAGEWLQDE